MNRRILLAALTGMLAAHGAGATGELAKPGPAERAASTSASSPTQYWYDGNTRRQLQIDTGHTAEFSPSAKGGIVLHRSLGVLAPAKQVSPVFVDPDAPAVRRALPGGVIISLSQAIAAPELAAKLSPFGASVSRALDANGTRWLIDSAPGQPALELANRLYESGQFESAAPNWWRERALK